MDVPTQESGTGSAQLCISDIYPPFTYPNPRDITTFFSVINSGRENINNSVTLLNEQQLPTPVAEFNNELEENITDTQYCNGKRKANVTLDTGYLPQQDDDGVKKEDSVKEGADSGLGSGSSRSTSYQNGALDRSQTDFEDERTNPKCYPSTNLKGGVELSGYGAQHTYGCGVYLRRQGHADVKWRVYKPGTPCHKIVTEALQSEYCVEGVTVLPSAQCSVKGCGKLIEFTRRITTDVVIEFCFPS